MERVKRPIAALVVLGIGALIGWLVAESEEARIAVALATLLLLVLLAVTTRPVAERFWRFLARHIEPRMNTQTAAQKPASGDLRRCAQMVRKELGDAEDIISRWIQGSQFGRQRLLSIEWDKCAPVLADDRSGDAAHDAAAKAYRHIRRINDWVDRLPEQEPPRGGTYAIHSQQPDSIMGRGKDRLESDLDDIRKAREALRLLSLET